MHEQSIQEHIQQAHQREWFYDYPLPDGSHTATYHQGGLQSIHDTRWRMMNAYLDAHYSGDRSKLSVLDLACHQGWFAWQMARAGFASVLGIDARESHVQDSSLIASIYGMDHLAFRQVL